MQLKLELVPHTARHRVEPLYPMSMPAGALQTDTKSSYKWMSKEGSAEQCWGSHPSAPLQPRALFTAWEALAPRRQALEPSALVLHRFPSDRTCQPAGARDVLPVAGPWTGRAQRKSSKWNLQTYGNKPSGKELKIIS